MNQPLPDSQQEGCVVNPISVVTTGSSKGLSTSHMKTNFYTVEGFGRQFKMLCLLAAALFCLTPNLQAQDPTISVRFANPRYNCLLNQYCLDVEFQSDTEDQRVFGMNVRFFYDEAILEFDSLTNFQSGYSLVAPIPPTIITGPPGTGFTLFGFGTPGVGQGEYVNGAIQLTDPLDTTYISTTGWTRLYTACFTVDSAGLDPAVFCPSVVWNLQNDGTGGWLVGDDGVVITVADPADATLSLSATEMVDQFNWAYSMNPPTTPPFGAPIQESCISLECIPVIVCPADVTIECTDSTSPDSTGVATADSICGVAVTVTSFDDIIAGACPASYSINRSWVATNECGIADTCVQVITVVDSTPPVVVCPADLTVECTDDTSTDSLGYATATDNCDTSVVVSVSDSIVEGNCPYNFVILRSFVGVDDCGNADTCVQTITVQDTVGPEFDTTNCPMVFEFNTSEGVECPDSALVSLLLNVALGQALGESESWFVGSIEVPGADGCLSDNCSDPDSMTLFFSSSLSVPDSCGYTHTFGFNVVDECGNFSDSTYTYTVRVNDDTPPVITCPADVTLECDDDTSIAAVGNATATDNCDTLVDITVEEVIIPGSCPGNYTIERLFIGADNCGNADSCLQTIVVEDTSAPALTCPVDVTIECTDDTSVDSLGTATAVDNCDTLVTITVEDVVTAGTCVGNYTIERSFIGTDDCGNADTCVQLITVEDTTPPVLTCPADLTIECDDDTSVDSTGVATGVDACDTSVTIISFDLVIPGSCPGSYSIQRSFVGSDVCGNADTCVQTIIVLDTTAPEITCPADVTVECTDDTSVDSLGIATATDNCDTLVDVTVQDEIITGNCPGNYTIERSFIGADDCGNADTCVQIITVQDITAPEITCPVDVTVECTDDTSVDSLGLATATDNCDTLVDVTFADEIIAGNCPGNYIIERSFIGTDDCGNADTCVQIITVEDTTAPEITCPVDVTVECTSDTSVDGIGNATADDACDTLVTITSEDLVTPGSCPGNYSITRSFYAADQCGNVDTCVQTITVIDTVAPVITCPLDVTVECTEDTSADSLGIATAVDACDTLVSIFVSDSITAGNCVGNFTIARSFIAIDQCGNADTCVQTITVEDTTAPVLTCPADLTIECDDDSSVDSLGTATGVDACDTAVTIVSFDVITPGACPGSYTIERNFVGSDVCGNADTCVQTITVQDLTAPEITCPVDVTVECTDDTSVDSLGLATATDNCDTLVDVTFEDVIVAGDCPGNYTIERTFIGTDDCLNADTCVQIITVIDTIAPSFEVCPADVTVECTDDTSADSLGVALAFDACDTLVTITVEDEITAGDCPGNYTITRIHIAADQCGNADTCVQIITVEDTTPPVVTCPADLTVECTDDTSADSLGMATAVDACDTLVTISISDSITTGECVGNYTIARSFIAVDQCGNADTCIQTITVEDTTPPVLTCPADLTIECDDDSSVDSTGVATGVDACDTTVTISNFDVITAGQCAGSYIIERNFVGTDGCGNADTCVQTIMVQDVTAPEITCPVDVTVECTDDTSVDSLGLATATDNCDTLVDVTFEDEIIAGDCPGNYTIERTFIGTDDCLNADTCVQIITVIDTIAPSFEVCPADVTVECTDDTSADSLGVALAFDACDTLVTITVEDEITTGDCPGNYTITRSHIAADQCGNADTCVQIITVEDTTPPVVTCPADLTVECTDDTSADSLGMATAVDACDTLVTISISDSITTGECVGNYTIARSFIAVDQCGNADTCIQTITVEDTTPPVLTCPADLTIECDDDSSVDSTGVATGVDACDTTVTISNFDVITAGQCAGSYIIERNFVGTDGCGNADTCVQTIMVQDVTAPEITCPVDVTVECTDDTSVDSLGLATATDNCDTLVDVTFEDVIIAGDCPGNYTIERTFIGTDDCLNADTCVQIITVIDTIAPSFEVCPADVTVECTDDTSADSLGLALAFDACDTLVTITVEDEITPGDCPGNYTITRSHIAADQCGNADTCVQIITVEDTTAPAFEVCPADVTVECTDDTSADSLGLALAFDACDTLVTVTVEDEITPGECPGNYTITRNHIAADQCGNADTCVQIITVIDTTGPVMTCPADITVECDDDTSVDSLGIATAVDACDTTATVENFDEITEGQCAGSYIITRSFVGTDGCGNTDTCVQIITVEDTTPPVITCPADVTIECTESTSIDSTGLATAIDNCDTLVDISVTTEFVDGECNWNFTLVHTFIAVDDCGNADTCVQMVTVIDTVAPVITCPADITLDCSTDPNSEVAGEADATDNCSGSEGISVEFTDEVVSESCPMVIERLWVATDECGNADSCVQILTLIDTIPPVIDNCPSSEPVTVQCSEDITPAVVITYTDNCSDATDSIAEVVTDSTCVNGFTLTRTYYAIDECGNSSTCVEVFIVDDTTPPTVECPATITVECDAVPDPDETLVTATDNCENGDVTVTFDEDIIDGGECTGNYTIQRSYIVTDACGNATNCFQTIVVEDTTPPTITCPPAVTFECAADVPEPNVDDVVATDNCGGLVSVDHNGDETTQGDCPNDFTITRTYIAVDDCGNTATCTQLITVFDDVAPTITCPANVTIDFGDDESPESNGEPTVADNCDEPTFEFVDDSIPGACEMEYVLNRLWTVTDLCGNTATCLQVITVDGDCLLDLSLTKDIVTTGSIEPLENVVFEITVSNEGETTVGSVIIIDYIPQGFTLNDPDWTPGTAGSTGQSATIELSIANGGLDMTGLDPGESVTVEITIQANADIQPGYYFNFAEIQFIFNTDGDDISDQDIDSTPDDDDTNDPMGEDDIDSAPICVLPIVAIVGDGYVCPGEVVVYTVTNYNPDWTYVWNLNGGGTIIDDNGETITIEWSDEPGGPFEVSVDVILGDGCSTGDFLNVYIQGVETLACNDLIQVSLDTNCQAVILSGMILEGEAEGNNNYYVVIFDENGNEIPEATLTGEHVGQTFLVRVENECNDQACWGYILVEDKLPPTIECTDVTVECGTDLTPIFAPPIGGTIVDSQTPGSPIGPNGGTVTTQNFIIDVPAEAVVTNVEITVDVTHTYTGDLSATLVSPSGTTIQLINQMCAGADNWDDLHFDDDAAVNIATACNPTPPPAILAGSYSPVQPLATFLNEPAAGTWQLVITDNIGGDGGTLNLAAFNISYFVQAPWAPVAEDACGEVILTYTETESGEDCENKTLTRVWIATDPSGNADTCTQTITITPLTLENILFPAAYEGECGGSIHPDVTGWPSIDGNPITDENSLCNIFVGYWDKELAECGGGRKIVRTWTVLDWCTLDLVEQIQVIKLSDNEGPVLVCPNDLTVGTDFWYCYANVSVPRPTATDECSEIETYELISEDGLVINFGNNYVINALELGEHVVTWVVSDECGNSSTCSFTITVVDDVVPVVNCDLHTVVALTNDGPQGITLVPASVFDDGSYDNCGPVTFRARRMESCIEIDWTTEGACVDDIPGGVPPVNSRDRGTIHRDCVPFACCDVGGEPVMVELEVTDASGNVNYCMVEVIVQDKISPFVECPPDIIVSCDFWFNVEEGTFVDGEGDNDGSLNEDPLSAVFGNMFDAFRYDESVRQPIVINDPDNEGYPQPYNWGLDGWADDNCEVNLQVRVRVIDDCSGGELPANAPAGAVKLIERRFSASDGNEGIAPGTCTQRIWVVDYDPFYIADVNCNNQDRNDGVIWPCDVLLTDCPEDLGNTGEPQIFDDACSLIGVTYVDTRFDFVDGACFKILREWSVIDWCQYNSITGEGLWKYVQVIKVHDEEGPEFVEPCVDVTICVADEGVSLPDNNQAFLGENDPEASSCSAHLALTRVVHETCSDAVSYDVKIYPFNGTEYILVKATTTVTVDENNDAVLSFDTRQSTIQAIRENGIPYNSMWCGDYHRILWSVEDGCGNWSHCEYLFRLEDCKQPSPVCINGLSTVVMPIGGTVTIWAKDFNASSFDDCTPSEELLYSFSGDEYQPSMEFNCDNVEEFNVQIPIQIWVADNGTDDNCNGTISWGERNKDFCTTTIVITDNNGACGGSGSILAGEVFTEEEHSVEKVIVTLTSPTHVFPTITTLTDGKYEFKNIPSGNDFTVAPERNDDHKNGVNTLDLVKIQKHLLGREEFTTPYQYIAADANDSKGVSAVDLIEIRKLILGLYTEFPNNQSWRFVDKRQEMDMDMVWPFNEVIVKDDYIGETYDNHFVGVKIGDVNNTVKASANQLLPRNGGRVLRVQMDAIETVKAGEDVVVTLTLPEAVEGFQWTLETNGLAFESATSEGLALNESNVGVHDDQLITMSWNDLTGSTEGIAGQQITIRFTALTNGAVAEMIKLTSRVTDAEAYSYTGEIMDVQLTSINAESEFALYQNQPNPWNGETSIGFDLPEAAKATMTFYDVTGKVIRVIDGDYSAGYNTVIISSKDIPASGVVYYRLESGTYTASKKMVIVE